MTTQQTNPQTATGLGLVVISAFIAVAYILLSTHPLWLMIAAIVLGTYAIHLLGKDSQATA